MQLGYGFELRHGAVAAVERTVLRAAVHVADGDRLPVVVELIDALAARIVGKRRAVPAVRDGKAAACRGTRVFRDADNAVRRGAGVAILHLVAVVVLHRRQVPIRVISIGAGLAVGIGNSGEPPGGVVAEANVQPVRRVDGGEPPAGIAQRRRAVRAVHDARNLPAAVVIDAQRIAVAVLELA